MFIKLPQLNRFWANAKTYINNLLNGYVAKEDGKGLSSNDFTTALKTNYDAAYTHSQTNHAPATAQANVMEGLTVNGENVPLSNKIANINVPKTVAELSDAGEYAKKTDMGKVYKYVGVVATYDELPTDLGAVGENDPILVYDCTDTGMNYGWTGSGWDNLGGIFEIEVATDADIDALFA